MDCNNPKMPLNISQRSLFKYKSNENVYNQFNCKKISPPPPPKKKKKEEEKDVSLHAQSINKIKSVSYLMQKGNKNKTAKQRKGELEG